MPRGWVIALVILAAAIGGATGSAITLSLRDDDSNARGTLVHLGPPNLLDGYPKHPFCVELHHFCLTQSTAGQVVALYTYDNRPQSREQGCVVRWDPGRTYSGDDAQAEVHGVFAAPCSGSLFDITGHRLSGPAPADLDTFPVEVTSDATIVDTRRLMCGVTPQGSYLCKRAPLGD